MFVWLRRLFVGVLALLGLVALVLFGTIYYAIDQLTPELPAQWRETALPERILLDITQTGALAETRANDPVALLTSGFDSQPTLVETLQAIDRAARDHRVGALYADLSHAEMGHAAAQELRDAVQRFRAAGKPAYAFADTFGEAGSASAVYYFASAFDEIWLQPSGDVGLTGFSMEFLFFRDALAAIGVEPQMFQRQEYKGVVEMLTRDGVSPPVQENYERLARSIFDQMVADIAAARSIEPAALRSLIDQAPLSSQAALQGGLVDRLAYIEAVRSAALSRAGADAVPTPLGRYARSQPDIQGEASDIALITGSGAIVRQAAGSSFSAETASSGRLVQAIDAAIADSDIEAILLRIDSPGGSYVASDSVMHAVGRARAAGKPVIAWMGDVAASGGYFIAMGADRIIAQPASITGSIGVAGGKIVVQGLLEKLGIGHDSVSIGRNALLYSPTQPLSDSGLEQFNAQLDRIYADFTGKAGQARNLDAAAIDRAARGRVWSGADAQAMGLVDDLGGYHTALAALRTALSLDPQAALNVVPFPPRKRPLDALMDNLGGDFFGILTQLQTLSRVMAALQPVLDQAAITLDPAPLHLPAPAAR
ncbi:MAG: S49 family peptidase [Alphaproteobacteria bacterium]|nr:S49 family peptidase [Alphaproteobacteria bacterium]MBU0797835.1 S49 family peptidase [Alphaproteobacteria bacterium]MBU1814573.1 S49 family peptidase [Alphaproteobacteria bacterium]